MNQLTPDQMLAEEAYQILRAADPSLPAPERVASAVINLIPGCPVTLSVELWMPKEAADRLLAGVIPTRMHRRSGRGHADPGETQTDE